MNAKELLIGKLGVDDNTIKVYAVAMSLGISPVTVFHQMTTPSIKALMAITKTNKFSKNKTEQLGIWIDKILNIVDRFTNKKINSNEILNDQRIAYNKAIGVAEDTPLTKRPDNPAHQAIYDKMQPLKIKGEDARRNLSDKIDKINKDFSPYGLELNDTGKSFRIKHTQENDKGVAVTSWVEIDLENLREVQTLLKAADEFSLLGGLFGVNQGVKPTIEEIIGYKEKLEKFINDKVPGKSFDFNLFISRINYCLSHKIDPLKDSVIKEAILSYEPVKEALNVPAIIAYNPSFATQMMAVVGVDTMLEGVSFRYKLVNKLITFLEFTNLKNSRMATGKKKVSSLLHFTTDVASSMFMSTHRQDFTANNFDLSNSTGREQFINWMNEQVFPDLKVSYPDNAFITNILVEDNRDGLFRAPIRNAKMRINTSGKELTDTNAAIMGSYEHGLRLIKDKDYKGENILKLLELYNFVAYRDADNSKAWGKYLIGVKGLENTITYKFAQYLNSISRYSFTYNDDGILIFDGTTYVGELSKSDILAYSGITKVKTIHPRNVEDDMDFQDYDMDHDSDDFDNNNIDENDFTGYDSEETTEEGAPVFKKTIQTSIVYDATANVSTLLIGKKRIPIKSVGLFNPTAISVSNSYKYKPTQEKATNSETLRILKILADKIQLRNAGLIISLDPQAENSGSIQGNELILNPNTAGESTLVHELGHAIFRLLKYDNPELFNALIELAPGLNYADDVISAYPDASPEVLAEEIIMRNLEEMANGNVPQELKDSPTKVHNLEDFTYEIVNFVGSSLDADKINAVTRINELISFINSKILRNKLVDITAPLEESKELESIDNILTDLQIQCH